MAKGDAGLLGELVELVDACGDLGGFRRGVLDLVARRLPYESAIFIDDALRQPPTAVNKEQFLGLVRNVQIDPGRYRAGLAKAANALVAGRGVYLDTEVFTTGERRNLPFYAEIVRPQRIRNQLVAHLQFRGAPAGILYLCRHGAVAPFRSRDVSRLAGLLPGIALAQAGMRSAPDPRSLGELTPRERQITQLVCRGLGNREIALLLGTSPITVRNQLTLLFDRLGLDNRTELAAWASDGAHSSFPRRG
jgi:DNA-binding CsgD family transcriptional regulator